MMHIISHFVFALAMLFGVSAETLATCQVPSQYLSIQLAVDQPNCNVILIEAGVYNENVSINRTVVIRGSGDVIVDGNQMGSVFTFSTGSVTLDGITIRNGSAENGGGVNSSADYTILNNVVFEGNSAESSGGAINVDGGMLTISNFTITDNHAENGGGIALAQAGLAMFTGRFVGNDSAENGGALFLSTETATVSSGTAQVAGVTFIDNTASGQGGAIFMQQGSMLINASTFENNQADGGGAAAFSGTQLDVRQTTFTNNSSMENGGAMMINGDALVRNTLLDQNTAGGNGGAIFSEDNRNTTTTPRTKLTVLDTQLHDNQAANGGAIGTSGNIALNLTNGVLQRNHATGVGGAIAGSGMVPPTGSGAVAVPLANIVNTTMTDNVATNGGAVAGSYAEINLFSGNLSSNRAKANGGAIFNNSIYPVTHRVNVQNALLGDNIAGNSGGAIWSNDHVFIRSSQLTRNRARDGGGIYAATNDNGSTIDIATVEIDNNMAAIDGGGIYVSERVTATLRLLSLTNNQATNGGGLYTKSIPSLKQLAVEGNRAANDGGGIHGGVALQSVSVVRNSAENNGGGIFSPSGISIDSSTISTNNAKLGSGIYAYSGLLTFATIANNDGGAAVYKWNTNQSLHFINSIIDNQTVNNCAGDTDGITGDNSIDSDGTCGFATRDNLSLIDPMLEPLVEVSDGVWVHPLSAESPARSMGVNCEGTDQQGQARPASGCDLGAYQTATTIPTSIALQTISAATPSSWLFVLFTILTIATLLVHVSGLPTAKTNKQRQG